MFFESVEEATRIWIKGREFSVARLLGDAYKDEASKYVGGALGIFRLAPQVSELLRALLLSDLSAYPGLTGRITTVSTFPLMERLAR